MIGKLPRDTDFEYARRKAFWNDLFAFLARRPNRLLSWDKARHKLGAGGDIYRGVQTVAVDQIVGSVGRYRDFDRTFLPTKDSSAPRWLAIARANYNAVSLPPVQLYKVGEFYFVLDGHHRVSVARERGIQYIDAKVTEVATRVPAPNHLDADSLEIKGEYTRFLERTQLDRLRPDQCIEFTIASSYERLLEHIALHHDSMGQEASRPASREEAICDWYDHVYLPLVRIIREKDILADFPSRTEADLYLWIVDHQRYLREQCGPGVIPERIAEHFAKRYGGHLLRRAINVVREWISTSACELVTGSGTDAGESTSGDDL
jgi:hypothetical protein